MASSDMDILVLGLGNTLLTDEAVGVRVVEHLNARPDDSAPRLRGLDGGTMGLTLLVEMEDADALIVVDAAYLGQPPGTIKVFLGPEMDDFLRRRGRNPHDIGLDDLMDGLRLREAVPENRALIAIQSQNIRVGEQMTAPVANAVPEAAEIIVALANEWCAKAP